MFFCAALVILMIIKFRFPKGKIYTPSDSLSLINRWKTELGVNIVNNLE